MIFTWIKNNLFRRKRINQKPVQTFINTFYLKDKINNPNWKIGDFTYGDPLVLDWGEGTKLHIGKFCSIAEDVKIFLGGNHRADWLSTYPFNKIHSFNDVAGNISGHPLSKGDVIIGNDVWIGFGALILSGVKIGNGAIIGAHALVTKDVEPYEIVGGNPAKHIKFRFSHEVIEKLNAIEWWNRDETQIRSLVKLLCSSRFENFETKLNELDYELYKKNI